MSTAADPLDRDPITWRCPYCNETTSDSERGVRVHINNSGDDPHEGISGWEIDQHIPGYDPDGHLIAAIRASTDQHSEEAVVPAEAIRNADWHHEFTSEDEPAPTPSPEPSQLVSDEDSPPPEEVEISLDALDEIQTILAHYREAGKRTERLAEPGSVLAARGQARWHTAGRFIEMFDSLHRDTEDRPAQAGHDREL